MHADLQRSRNNLFHSRLEISLLCRISRVQRRNLTAAVSSKNKYNQVLCSEQHISGRSALLASQANNYTIHNIQYTYWGRGVIIVAWLQLIHSAVPPGGEFWHHDNVTVQRGADWLTLSTNQTIDSLRILTDLQPLDHQHRDTAFCCFGVYTDHVYSMRLYYVLVTIASLGDVMITTGASNYSDDVMRTRDSARHNLLALDKGRFHILWSFFLMPNTHRRRRRDSTVELSRVGGVNAPVGSRDSWPSLQFSVLLSYWGWWQVTTYWRHCWTRKLCYRKDDRAMRPIGPIHGCPENFRDSWQRPRLIFPTFFMGLCSDRPMYVPTKFEVRPFLR